MKDRDETRDEAAEAMEKLQRRVGQALGRGFVGAVRDKIGQAV